MDKLHIGEKKEKNLIMNDVWVNLKAEKKMFDYEYEKRDSENVNNIKIKPHI